MNISDIAKLACVSPAAVSRYLNDGYLSQEKKTRIAQVIQETGYKPSQSAKILRTGKTGLIGVIIPKIDSDSISQVVAGISEVLSRQGYQLLLANTENDSQKELEYLSTFQEHKVEGIIHLATLNSQKHIKAFQELSIPSVVLGQKATGQSCIYHDDYHAAYDLTSHVINKGHKNIGFIGVTEKDIAVGKMRKIGFLDAMNAAGLPVPEDILYTGSFYMDNGYENTPKLLKSHKNADAIICATDTIALGTIKYLNEHHISIPDEIAVAGFGENKASSVLSPTLTTVHFFYKECGIEGAKLLLNQIENQSSPNKSVLLGYEIRTNQSV